MYRKFIKRKGNGFSSCYMCASREEYSYEFDSCLYTDTKYGLPICYDCIKDKMIETEEDYVIEDDKKVIFRHTKLI